MHENLALLKQMEMATRTNDEIMSMVDAKVAKPSSPREPNSPGDGTSLSYARRREGPWSQARFRSLSATQLVHKMPVPSSLT